MVYSIDRVLQNTRDAREGKPAPAGPLEDPLGHLVACHGRIEERLQILERAGQYLEGTAEQQRQALDAIAGSIRYFDTSGVHHTEDEEESLFPRLEKKLAGQPDAPLAALMGQLEEQHRAVERTYVRFVRVARELEKGIETKGVQKYRQLVRELAAQYRPHIELENTRLFPLAQGALAVEDIAGIRDEMRKRRNF